MGASPIFDGLVKLSSVYPLFDMNLLFDSFVCNGFFSSVVLDALGRLL